MKKFLKKVVLTLFVFSATAAYGPDVDSFIELLRSDVKTEKRAIITDVMKFNSEEASAFWPVYRKYEFELDKLGDARLALIKEYAEHSRV